MDFTKGEESLLYIKKNDIWVPVGCLSSSPLSESSETIDTTTRDNNGWATSLPTIQNYSIEISGLVKKDDEDSGNLLFSYRELRKLKRNRSLVDWMRKFENGWYVDSGKAYITSISDSDNVGEYITFTATLTGYGSPIESNERVYVLGDNSQDQIYTHEDEITVITTQD